MEVAVLARGGAGRGGGSRRGGGGSAWRVLARVVLVSGGPEGPRPRVHPADEPLLLADDLAAVRGDGCFETLLVVGGRPAKPERHLARLARSAAALGLTGPSESAWRAGMDLAAREWGTRTEAMLRLVLSRGPERGGQETAYITVAPVSPAVAADPSTDTNTISA